MTDEVRIRLEGRLEVLEAAAAALETLTGLARSPRWEREAGKVREVIGLYQALAPRLEEATAAALALGEAGAPGRLEGARRALHARLAWLGPRELEARLDGWLRLAEHTGTRRQGRPLASAEVQVGLPRWVYLAVAAVGVALAPSTHGVSLEVLAVGAALWWLGDRRGARARVASFRLFADALEVDEPGAPTRSLPLASLSPVEARPGATLRGLRTVTLPSSAGLLALCERLNELLAERAALLRQEQVLRGFAGERVEARWLPATLEGVGREPDQVVRSGPVPVVRFGRAWTGGALLTGRGVLFVSQSAEASVRKAVFGAEVTLLRQQQRPLLSFPAGLLLERLAELRALRGVVWVDAAEPAAWIAEGPQEHLTLPAGRLSLTLDDAARAHLRRVWPR